MTTQDIERGLARTIAAIVGKQESDLSGATELSDVGADSLMLVEIFVFVEKEYGIKLLESDVSGDDLKSIGSLAAYIATRT